MNSKITILIPVYNTARYLSQCLDSVIKQDYKNLEIILINDASTDNSLEICKQFSQRDNRIKVIDKKYNEGVECARFSGFKFATGDYIMYVDSDDWLAHHYVLSSMYKRAEETGADYVEVKAYRTFDKFGLIKKKITNKGIYGLIEQPELFDEYFLSFFGRSILSVTMWGKLYRKSFLDKICIIPLGIKIGEDLGYNIQLFPHLNKIYIINEPGYYYRYGGMSTKFIPDLMADAKKIHIFRERMIEKYYYNKAQVINKKDFIGLLKSDIQQRIRFKYKKEDTIKFLIKEITDTVYKTISDFYKKTISWNDPLVEAISKMDVEKIYEICYYSEKKLWWRRKLVRLAYNIFR